jgi:multiple sugar transport system substrate-binding protein
MLVERQPAIHAAPAHAARIASLTLLAALLVAIGLLAPQAAGVRGADEARPVSFMVFGDPAELAAYGSLVAAFEVAHPDIDIELIHIPSQSDYRLRLGADFAAGSPPDVALINYRRYAAFAARGVLEPLERYLRGSDVIAETDFYPEAISPFRWRGELMCIPQNVSSLVVYYDKDLFDAAGLAYPADDWSWDDFLATAEALTKDLDGDGRTDQYGLGTEASIFRVAPFIWQNGGELVVAEQDGIPLRLAVDSRAAREAIEWFVALQTEHGVVPDASAEAAQDSESRFLDGSLAMFLDSRRAVPTFRQIEAFDWDVAPLPRREQAAGILHSDAYCMAGAAQDKDAAWTFIEFANSPEGQAIVAESGRTVPSLSEVAESEAFLDPEAKPANSQVFLETIPILREVPVMAGWVDVEELAGDELERAFYGQATVDEAISAMITRTLPFFAGEEG